MRQSPKGPFIFIAATLPVCVQQASVSCPTRLPVASMYLHTERSGGLGKESSGVEISRPYCLSCPGGCKAGRLQAAQGISSSYSGL